MLHVADERQQRIGEKSAKQTEHDDVGRGVDAEDRGRRYEYRADDVCGQPVTPHDQQEQMSGGPQRRRKRDVEVRDGGQAIADRTRPLQAGIRRGRPRYEAFNATRTTASHTPAQKRRGGDALIAGPGGVGRT